MTLPLYLLILHLVKDLILAILPIIIVFLKRTSAILAAKDKAEAIVTAFGLKAASLRATAVARRIPFVDTSMVVPQHHSTAFALVVRPIVVSFFISG